MNVWMALTNLAFLVPISVAYQNQEYLAVWCLTAAMLASGAYHLVENQKHQLPGAFPRLRKQWNTNLLNIDRLAALQAILVFSHKYGLRPLLQQHLWVVLFIGISLLISESIYRYVKWPYVATHTIWHWGAAYIAWLMLIIDIGARLQPIDTQKQTKRDLNLITGTL